MAIAGLEVLDGKLLDGLEFCAQAYAAFDRIRNSPGGIEELRMLTSPRAKKMVEEILPLASYVQARYGPGLRLKIRWIGGSQSYDAYVGCSGSDVQHGGVLKRQFLEVTTALHENDYLVREHLNEEGFAFAPRGTRRDPKTRAVTSTPSVYGYRQPEAELVDQISERIAKKAEKRYPKPTLLLIRCVVNMPILDDEWDYVVQELRKREEPLPFREVILLEPVSQRFTTLYFRRPKSRGRSDKALQPRSRAQGQLGSNTKRRAARG
jgi:hypothetical protein